MDLPVLPPVKPMLAKAATKLPVGDGVYYEPKWDGAGEIVAPRGDRLHFEDLLQRIPPAESRINLLAEQTPASFVAFDLLAIGEESLLETPFAERRARLQEVVTATESVHLTAITQDPGTAQRWFEEFEGAGLDGVVAKAADLPYG